MAGEINFGILDPRLGASFATGYNEAEDRRNELAARVQQRALGEQQLQHAMSQNELSKYTLSTAKRSDAQQEALNAYVNDPKFNPNDPAQLQKLMGFGAPGQAMLKAVMDRTKTQGDITKTQGDITKQNLDAAKFKHDALASGLAPLAAAIQAGKPITHNDVFGAAQQLLGSNVISQKDLASIPMRSENLPQYIMGLVASNDNSRNALKMYMPEAMIAGGAVINKNPMAPGGIGNRLADVTMTPFETTRLPQFQQSANASTEQARAAIRNAATGEAREARLAKGPVGTSLTPEQNDALFGENGAVAAGKLNPNKINSRNASMWADAFLRNPNADPVKIARDVETTTKAVKDFGTGPQGVKIIAFNTAIDDLDPLYQLGEALKNKDMMALNAAANFFGVQTGQPATTMYNQAARIVGAEISKAIVPGVGTGREREETAKAFNSASSPDQLAGADVVAKKLLGGQLASLEQQYKRTTKREDFAEQLLSPAGRKAYQSSRSAMKPTNATPAVAAPAETASAGVKFLGFEPGKP
jgi:hypothetical protein